MFTTSSVYALQETNQKATETKAAEKDKTEEDTPKKKFSAIRKEIGKLQRDMRKKIMKLREEFGDDREKFMEAAMKAQKENDAEVDKMLPAVLEVAKLADEDAKTAMSAITYIMGQAKSSDLKNQAIKLLVENHIDNKELPKMLGRLGSGMPSQPIRNLYEALLAKSENEQLKGMAALGLAEHLKGLNRFRSMLEESPDFAKAYPDIAKYIESAADDLELESLRTRFNEISETYKDVNPVKGIRGMDSSKTIAELASRSFKTYEKRLLAKQRIAVGKTVPEIEGPDLDGTNFKLSDYRGKVVLLDFWGDW